MHRFLRTTQRARYLPTKGSIATSHSGIPEVTQFTRHLSKKGSDSAGIPVVQEASTALPQKATALPQAFSHIIRDMDRMMNQSMRQMSRLTSAFSPLTPTMGDFPVLGLGGLAIAPVDIVEEPKQFVVTVDMPGFDRDHIHLKATPDGTLRISAERLRETEQHRKFFHSRERMLSSLSRSVVLPSTNVLWDQAHSEYKNGCLHIEVPKSEVHEEDAKQIPVK